MFRPVTSRISSTSSTAAALFAYQPVRYRKYLPFHEERKAASKLKSSQQNRIGAATASNVEKQQLSTRDTAVAGDSSTHVSPYQAALLLKAFDMTFPPLENTVQNVKLSLRLDVDLSRKSVRGMCKLPYGVGGTTKLMVFCRDEMAAEMLEIGADFAGTTVPLERIAAGKVDFDRCIAPPELMPQLMRVARVLGPLKLMPNPKSGTVVSDLREATLSAKSGSTLEYRAEGEGELTITIASTSFETEQILENIRFFIREVLQHRPRASQGESNSSSNLGLKWPPRRSIDKEVAAHRLAGNSNEFILSAYLKSETSPPIRISTPLLAPQSMGYYR